MQFDPAAAFAGQAVGLKPEAKTIEISVVVLNRAGGAEIVGGRQLGDTLRRRNPRRSSAE